MAGTATPKRSGFHRFIRAILILISLASMVAFIYFSTHHGVLQVKGHIFPVPADVAALGSPILGITALWLAVVVENHERTRRLIPALTETFFRLWWIFAFILFVAAWVWFTNH